CLQYTHVPFTF
nr:immunoglobulin light chain junction region [Macaca mulatta]MOW53101.1 immunoglobulin light chain junction region [Macaca mulatta]